MIRVRQSAIGMTRSRGLAVTFQKAIFVATVMTENPSPPSSPNVGAIVGGVVAGVAVVGVAGGVTLYFIKKKKPSVVHASADEKAAEQKGPQGGQQMTTVQQPA